MSPITHFLVGWSAATCGNLRLRERALVTIAGIAPDIDGAGLIFGIFSSEKDAPLKWWGEYHHVLGHNIGFGLLLAFAAFAMSTKRWLVSLLAMVSFHLHLLGDVLGAKGPEGYQWPIPYLLPFSDAWQWEWSGQWQLNAWPNFVITFVFISYMFYYAWKKGASPLEFISAKANRSVVDTLRQRFGTPEGKRDKNAYPSMMESLKNAKSPSPLVGESRIKSE